MPNGGRFVIDARGNSSEKVYIRRAQLNDRELTRNFITNQEIIAGGSLVLDMDATPVRDQGVGPRRALFPVSRVDT